MQSEDQQAIQQVLSGDSAAYAILVDKYQQRLLGLLFHACGDRCLTEDIGQEAFARAYRKLDTYAGNSQFYTWLARIAMNLLISHRRKKRIENQATREGFDVVLESASSQDHLEDSLAQSETQRCVREAIAMLDEQRRAVLLLRDFDGMEYEAISETLGVPLGTVRSRLHRARLELKTILQQRAVELGL